MTTTVVIEQTGDDYTIHGSKDAGTPSLVRDGLQEPAPVFVVDMGAPAMFLHGDAPTSRRRPNAVLGMLVRVESATETAHKTAVAALRAAVEQFQYNTTITKTGSATTWRCYAGTVTPVGGARIVDTTGLIVERYNVTIPVHPIEVI